MLPPAERGPTVEPTDSGRPPEPCETGDSAGRLPVVEPPAAAPRDPAPTVAGVLLAAGTSERFGAQNKLLAPVGGVPLVRRAAGPLVEADLDRVVAVLGHEAGRVDRALADLPVETVTNETYEDGQASSLRAGIEAVRTGPPDAVVVALGDMPFVSPETVNALVAAYRAGAGTALAPVHDDRRGNPVLFDSRHYDALAAVEGDVGGRAVLLESDEGALVTVDDPGVLRDVDVPSDR